MIRMRLLYTAIVRPAMVYGVHAWHTGQNGKQMKANLQQLEKIQNKCLRRITGGYKRTPRAALEREAKIMPLDLYCDALIMNKAIDKKGKKVQEEIKQTVNAIWEAENRRPPQRTQRRRDPREARQRPPTSSEQVQRKAIERQLEIRGYRAHLAERAEREGPSRARRPRANRAPPGRQQKEKLIINEWAELEWQRRWRL